MRNDLSSLGVGRACAQASHASNAFIHKFGQRGDVIAWSHQTPQGFGTAIVLSTDIDDIVETLDGCNNAGFNVYDTIVDPDYVVSIPTELVRFLNDGDTRIKIEPSKTDPTKYLIHRSEVTCAYVFGDKEQLSPILSKFPLYS